MNYTPNFVLLLGVAKEMKTIQKNEIFDDKTTGKITGELQPVLVELIALGLTTKQAHWNVVGSSFRAVHLQLDEIHAFIQTGVDTVAERISALGVPPNGQACDVSEDAKLKAIPAGFHNAAEIIDLMTARVAQSCKLIRNHMDKIEDLDAVTSDMLHSIVEGLEKQLWMLRVQGM